MDLKDSLDTYCYQLHLLILVLTHLLQFGKFYFIIVCFCCHNVYLTISRTISRYTFHDIVGNVDDKYG